MELRTKTNQEITELYEAEIILHHRSRKGLSEARRITGLYFQYLGGRSPSPETAKVFLSQFSEKKPTTLYRYTAILKALMAWYGQPLDLHIRVPLTLPEYVDKADIDKLIEAMGDKKSHKRSATRDKLLVRLAMNTGLRRSELSNLKVGDIDVDKGIIIVRLGKGQKDRVVGILQSLKAELADYMVGKAKDESLFHLAPASISVKIKRFADRAGVKIHTHSLRDSFASRLLVAGANIREVQELLGHANLNNTQRYTLLHPGSLQKAIQKLDEIEEDLEKLEFRKFIESRQVIT